MRTLRCACLAVLILAFMPAVSEARSRWGVSFGYSSGRYCGPGMSIGYGYSYGYRPSFVHGYSRSCYAPVVYHRPVHYAPAYCPPAPVYIDRPIYYRTPSFRDYGYDAPVYYGTPQFQRSYNYVSVSYASGHRYHDRGYTYVDRGHSYVDRGYSYCPPAKGHAYSSYYRR